MNFSILFFFSKLLCTRLCVWIFFCHCAHCLQLRSQNPLTPLLFHGFINNEHYQHWLPNTRDSELHIGSYDVVMKEKKLNRQGTTYLKCPIGTKIWIIKAIYNQTTSSLRKNTKKEMAVDVTWSTQRMCKNNIACTINSSCKLLESKHICYNNDGHLQLTYTCQMTSMEPFPLFNGQTKMYREGVSPEFLTLSGIHF
ncbi:uncharacterized protein LOC128884478 [Hylaeus volcanicus]|uniref:uncharacterized protein LOC128884478 n=1 Tax=Hylaeus volcanicus TaxID=313075 RepID=UPI0023B8786E|nr:uncharacterized protein LOC128884478 [Hylaeus volcanicus]